MIDIETVARRFIENPLNFVVLGGFETHKLPTVGRWVWIGGSVLSSQPLRRQQRVSVADAPRCWLPGFDFLRSKAVWSPGYRPPRVCYLLITSSAFFV